MLVLTRRNGEAIHMDCGRIIIRILSVGEGRVRLGIDAPGYVDILRGELVKQPAACSEAEAEQCQTT